MAASGDEEESSWGYQNDTLTWSWASPSDAPDPPGDSGANQTAVLMHMRLEAAEKRIHSHPSHPRANG